MTQWGITTSGNVYTVTHGQVDGKMQTVLTECFGKNLSKANATTDEQQCIMEAEALHTKKQKSGYVTDPTGQQSTLSPMKVSVYQDMKHKLNFDTEVVYESPKLDGVNLEVRLVNGELIFISRGGTLYPPIPHLEPEILDIMAKLNTTSLNGELYIHGEHLQIITGAVKKTKPISSKLEFHIFDGPELSGSYTERYDALTRATLFGGKFVKLIQATPVKSLEDIERMHDYYVSRGYEGLVARNSSAKYIYNTRSMDVMKLKVQLDGEYLVLGYKLDKSKHPVWLCQSDGGEFSVKIATYSEQNLEYAANADSYIGKYLNIKYEKLSLAGKPTKGVGQYFRVVNQQTKEVID